MASPMIQFELDEPHLQFFVAKEGATRVFRQSECEVQQHPTIWYLLFHKLQQSIANKSWF
jgi:hypothetical protein